MMNETTRRITLRVITKIMILMAFVWIAWVYWGYLTHSNAPIGRPALDIDLTGLAPGDYMIVRLTGQTLYVWHRTDEMLAQLVTYDDQLHDPKSLYSSQPSAAKNHFRSMDPKYLVVFAKINETGCDAVVVSANTDNIPVSPWFGGFKDACGDTYFDLAGRSYVNESVRYNLEVPPHQIIGGRLFIIENH